MTATISNPVRPSVNPAVRVDNESSGPSWKAHAIYWGEMDWLRGGLALLVMLTHSPLKPLITGGHAGVERVMGRGAVEVFFALSGFLVGGILLDRAKRRGFIGWLPTFYYRRALRIWVPYFILIACFSLLLLVRGRIDTGYWSLLPAALTYTYNWPTFYGDTTDAWRPIHQIWSLGVEEQFYIFSPLLLGMLWNLRVALLVLTVGFFVQWTFFHDIGFYTSMNVGIALAALYRLLPNGAWTRLRWVSIVAAPALMAYVAWSEAMPGSIPMSVGAGLVVVACSRVWSGTPLSRWVGAASYTAYLWHTVALYFAGPAVQRVGVGGVPGDVLVTLGMIAGTLAVCWCSVRYVERPLMRRRDTIAERAPWAVYAAATLAVGGMAVGLLWLHLGPTPAL